MSRESTPGNPDGQERAAEIAEDREDYRTAFGLWKDLISKWGDIVSSDRVAYWERHMEYCDEKMKA